MSIGLGIFLIAIGAILVWALNVQLDWIDLDTVGYVLIVAGVVIVILGLVFLMRRRRTESTTRTSVDPANGQSVTRSESSEPEL